MDRRAPSVLKDMPMTAGCTLLSNGFWPNGDASRAPDIVNNSWGNDNGATEEFRQDAQTLNAAGIAAFFSNGNSGPGPDTVGAPASYSETLGVGATDMFDTIAWFSSRGPSPFGVMKPDVSAGCECSIEHPGQCVS
jgi:hypothetical protein